MVHGTDTINMSSSRPTYTLSEVGTLLIWYVVIIICFTRARRYGNVECTYHLHNSNTTITPCHLMCSLAVRNAVYNYDTLGGL